MTDAPTLCPRCGSGGYGCYECTPRTYTQADLDTHIGAVLDEAVDAIQQNVLMLNKIGMEDEAVSLAIYGRDTIRALRPDALQVLDRVRREARVEGMRKLLEVGWAAADAYPDQYGNVWDVGAYAMADFIAAEERGEGSQ